MQLFLKPLRATTELALHKEVAGVQSFPILFNIYSKGALKIEQEIME